MSALFTSAFLSCVISVIVLPTLPSPSSAVLLKVPIGHTMKITLSLFLGWYSCQLHKLTLKLISGLIILTVVFPAISNFIHSYSVLEAYLDWSLAL